VTKAHPRTVRSVRHALIEARTSRDGFEVALAALADLVGAHSALAFVPSHDYRVGYALDMVGWRAQDLHERAQKEAAAHGLIDPWRAGAAKLGAFERPLIALGEELTNDAEMAKSPWGTFFGDFDVRHLLGYTAPARELGAPTVFLSLYRAAGQKAFGERQRRQLLALSAEFNATAEMRMSLTQDAPHPDQTLISVSDPAFLVGRGGVVTWANDAGQSLLRAGGLVRMEGNALTAARGDRAELVRATILRALHGRSGAVSLARVANQHFYLGATPLKFAERTFALVRLRDARATRTPAVEDLIEVFDFTPAEAAVAVAMCQHLTANQIARLRGVDVETVRKQVRNIFAKLQVRKASEAIVMLSRLAD
jgi:DNA-binding CsgD family transcriptional regulator